MKNYELQPYCRHLTPQILNTVAFKSQKKFFYLQEDVGCYKKVFGVLNRLQPVPAQFPGTYRSKFRKSYLVQKYKKNFRQHYVTYTLPIMFLGC